MANSADAQRSFEQGVVHHRAGQLAQAERCYQAALARDAEHEQAAFLLAAIAIEAGRSAQAVELLEKLVATRPGNANYFTNLGEAQRRLGNFERAAGALVQAVALAPELPHAHFNLGLVTRELGEDKTALQAFERAAELKPDSLQIQHALARALVALGEDARAVGHFQCALVQAPNALDVVIDYSACLRKLRRFEASLRYAERALELAPTSADAHHERAATLVELGRFDDALQSSDKAVALQPELAAAWRVRASAFTFAGRLEEGITAYRQALAREPDNESVHSNLIFLLPFLPSASASEILSEARAWAARHTGRFAQHVRPHLNGPEPERRLRVGYVSSNFNEHCQALFTFPLLEHHDRSQFELHAYSSVARPDATTKQLRAHFVHWWDISGLNTTEAAELIRSHGIDLLIDLTMHMAVSQLGIFACKPAPVQVAWLAYPGTTGLPAMDYRVTDRHLDPEAHSSESYSEASLVLPDSFWCYAPASSETVSDLPARANRHLTFGCLNSFWKLNDETFRLWARVLERVPASRLLLMAPEGEARARVRAVFAAAGVEPARIEFVSRRPRAEYLKLYHRVDVCLDALPYNGHTTSLDAFWMGVPVLTLVGHTVVGRAGLCQALNLGLPELVAHDSDAFVAAAVRLASDFQALATLRSTLRARMERSPLMDGARFARNLEAKYRQAWQRWCAGASRSGAP